MILKKLILELYDALECFDSYCKSASLPGGIVIPIVSMLDRLKVDLNFGGWDRNSLVLADQEFVAKNIRDKFLVKLATDSKRVNVVASQSYNKEKMILEYRLYNKLIPVFVVAFILDDGDTLDRYGGFSDNHKSFVSNVLDFLVLLEYRRGYSAHAISQLIFLFNKV